MNDEGNLILKTKATVETRNEKARHNSASFTTTARGQELQALTIAGDKRAIVLTIE